MKELDGIWWTQNSKKVVGTLHINDENKIYLTTYEKLYDTNVINGFSNGEKITLVDAILDRTDVYYKREKREEFGEIKNIEYNYNTYKYIAELAIFGYTYERKGDIRLDSMQINYTGLDKWIGWEAQEPKVKYKNNNILLEFKKHSKKEINVDKFKLSVENVYMFTKEKYSLSTISQNLISITDIKNKYIDSVRGIINCIQFFLVLCIGDNINVENILAKDIKGNKIQIILGNGKSYYENRSILKYIVNFKDIEKHLEQIMKKWSDIYEDNQLLIINFVNLQRREEFLSSEYINLMSAIDNLYLIITDQEKTNERFAEIVKQLLRDTNFIMELSEEQIEELAINIKDIRRYFVHSNKTQAELVNNNVSKVRGIVTILIEVVRARIMMEIGISSDIIEKYYKNMKPLENLKEDILNNVNEDELIDYDKIGKGRKVVRQLSKKDRDNIAELNALLGTSYKETSYDLGVTDDLISAVENITAEYMDYSQYWIGLNSIIENFDQSLEVFSPEKWFKVTTKGKTEDNLIDKTISYLNKAETNMNELANMAEERCKEIWIYLLLGKDKKAKEFFFGKIPKYTEENISNSLEYIFDNIYDVPYHNQVQDDAKNFAMSLKQCLEDNAKEEKERENHMKNLFIEYPKCSTCQKAKKWLQENDVEFDDRHILEETPTQQELEKWIELSGKEIKKWFNTSGLKYKELNLKEKLSDMSDKEKIKLLSSDGMLIKRPILITDNKILIGFKEEEWKQIL